MEVHTRDGFERNADGSFRRRALRARRPRRIPSARGGEIRTFGAGRAAARGASGSGSGSKSSAGGRDGAAPMGFDADTASIDSSAFVRDFQRRGGER